jgi:hypothetical protein
VQPSPGRRRTPSCSPPRTVSVPPGKLTRSSSSPSTTDRHWHVYGVISADASASPKAGQAPYQQAKGWLLAMTSGTFRRRFGPYPSYCDTLWKTPGQDSHDEVR